MFVKCRWLWCFVCSVSYDFEDDEKHHVSSTLATQLQSSVLFETLREKKRKKKRGHAFGFVLRKT